MNPFHRRSTVQIAKGDLMSGVVKLQTMIDILYAVHLSSRVNSPFQDRCGLMMVGPPSMLKSALLDVLDRHYHDSLSLSDINAKSLIDLRNQIAQGSIRTLVLSEYAKIYERDPRTAANVEGTVRALVAEGFKGASFEDQRVNRLVARCTVIGAMVPETQGDNFKRWENSGFNRRFLWPLVSLEDPEVLERAVEQQQLIEMETGRTPPVVPQGQIPDLTSVDERRGLRPLIKYQPGGSHATQLQLMVKMLAVLKWWYKRVGLPPGAAMRTMREFARTLTRGGAMLEVPEPGPDQPKRKTVAFKRRSHASRLGWKRRKRNHKKGRRR